jgi:hypothetical protein
MKRTRKRVFKSWRTKFHELIEKEKKKGLDEWYVTAPGGESEARYKDLYNFFLASNNPKKYSEITEL